MNEVKDDVMEAKRILAVEDEKDILDLYEYLFKEAGYEVLTSLTGENISEQINVFHPDLILLDINIAGMNGCDICREIKDNPETSPIVVILVSAQIRTRELMSYCRANEFIAKPFDIHQLLSRVGHAI